MLGPVLNRCRHWETGAEKAKFVAILGRPPYPSWVRRLSPVFIAIVAVALSGSSRAAEPAPPVYTNLDLEKFGTPPPAPEGPVVVSDEGWDAVRDFLDREYSRIDAQRAHDLQLKESDRRDRVTEAFAPGRDSFRSPVVGIWPYGCGGTAAPGWVWGGRWGADSGGCNRNGQSCGSSNSSIRTDRNRRGPAAAARAASDRHRAFLNRRETLYAAPRVAYPGAGESVRGRHKR